MEKENNLFEEYLKSAKDLVFERFSSPLIFSFTVSWLISNYKILMVVFTDQTSYFSLEYKIWLISEYLNWMNGFIYPIIASCFYTFLYPFLDNKISKFTLQRKLEKREDIHKLEKTQLITVKEKEDIHRRHFKVESALRDEMYSVRIVEEQLRVKIKELEANNKVAESKGESSAKDTKTRVDKNSYLLSSEDVVVIRILGEELNRGFNMVDEADIQKGANLSLTKVRLSLKNLMNNNYLFEGTRGYWLEQKGLEAYEEITHLAQKNDPVA